MKGHVWTFDDFVCTQNELYLFMYAGSTLIKHFLQIDGDLWPNLHQAKIKYLS